MSCIFLQCPSVRPPSLEEPSSRRPPFELSPPTPWPTLPEAFPENQQSFVNYFNSPYISDNDIITKPHQGLIMARYTDSSYNESAKRANNYVAFFDRLCNCLGSKLRYFCGSVP